MAVTTKEELLEDSFIPLKDRQTTCRRPTFRKLSLLFLATHFSLAKSTIEATFVAIV